MPQPVSDSVWAIQMVNSYFTQSVQLYMNIYVCGAYGPRLGVYIYYYCQLHLRIHLLSFIRRILTDVQTDAQNVDVDDDPLVRKMAVSLM